ncbi:hypothetical protein ACFWGI_06715 [Streptomyces niveus]|uniref:hypothetical protein n=1 Tax=Streptomyces niveus TaxID=193462 RepID=UPI0036699C1D
MQNKQNRVGIHRTFSLRDEESDLLRADGTRARRPLWDTGWGPERAARYAARCARYVDAARIELRVRGRAAVRLDFPYGGGRGPQRADAAHDVAALFGIQVRRLDRAAGRALRVTGNAEEVARFTAALPRILEHAESLASWAARMYGTWTRSSAHAEFFAALTPHQRRCHARTWRFHAFRTVVAALTGPDGAPVPEYDPAEVPWEQAAALAGGVGQYGWVDIRDAYDPAEAVQLLDAAVPVPVSVDTRPVPPGEQLALFDRPFPAQRRAGRVVIISGWRAGSPRAFESREGACQQVSGVRSPRLAISRNLRVVAGSSLVLR